MTTVAFLETSLRIGGAEMVWTNLLERLDRRRFQPILCCLYEPGPLAQRLVRAGVPVYGRVAAHRWDVLAAVRLIRLLRRQRVDVLYIMDQPLCQLWGTVCGRLAGVPALVTAVHSTGEVRRVRRRRWINRLAFRLVDRVTALSETHKGYLVSHERLGPDKVAIISNGIDTARFANPPDAAGHRRRFGLPDGAPIVGIVAMLRPEKQHDVLLRAAVSVLERVPTARFLIVGEGSERPRLELLAGTLGVADHVHFVGAQEDVPAVVSLFDVAVLCSRPVVETLSLSVLEYMASGKPVVATRVGSLPEVIEEGKTGFLVEPGDWEALAERIIQLLRDRSLAAQMGHAGQENVQQRYTIERMVQQTEALFERLLDGAVHSPRSTVHREEH